MFKLRRTYPLLVLLIFITSLPSFKQESRSEIDIGQTFEQTLDHKLHYFNVKYTTITKDYVLINSASKILSNPTQVFISITNETPSIDNNDYKAFQAGDNSLYIPKQYFQDKQLFYVAINCPYENCDIKLLISEVDKISLNKGTQYSFLSTSEGFEQTMVYTPDKDNYNDVVVAYCVGGVQTDIQEISLNFIPSQGETQTIPLEPKLYNGYITSFSESTYTLQGTTDKFELKVKAKNNSYITCGIRPITPIQTINTFASTELYIHFTNSLAEKECFIIDNDSKGQDIDNIIIDIVPYTQNCEIILSNKKTGLVTQSVSVETPSYIKLPYSELKDNYLCVRPMENEEILSLSMQIMNERNYVNAEPYRLPIINGVLKRSFLKLGTVTYYRHSKFDSNSKTLKMSLHSYKGEPVLYGYLCKSFPNCYFDTTKLLSMLADETEKTSLKTSHDVNDISTVYIESRSSEVSLIDKEQYIGIVYCKGEQNCEYSISFFDENDSVHILSDERHSDFLAQNTEDNFEFTLTSEHITKLEISITILTGDAEIVSVTQLPDKSKKEPTILHEGTKTIYLFERDNTQEKNDLVKQYKIKIKGLINSFYSIIYVPLYEDTEKIREVFSGEDSLQTIALSDGYKMFSLLNQDIKDNIPFISSFTALNCKVSIEFEKTKIKMMNDDTSALHIIKSNEPVYSSGIYTYQVTIKEMETKDAGDICKIMVSGKSQNFEKELGIEEGNPHTMTLTPGNIGAFSYLYPHHNQGGNVILNIKLFNEGLIKVGVSIEQGTTTYYTFSQSRQIILNEKALSEHCTPKYLCNIIISVSLVDQSIGADPISYKIIARSKDFIPVYLRKNELRSDVMNYDKVQYYFMDVGLNEVGEVLINFNRGSGKLFSRLVEKGAKETDPDYNGRIRLPKENDKDLLEYDPYTKKIYYNETVTNICTHGCEMYIGIKSEDTFIDTQYEYLLDYSIFSRTQNVDKFVSFPIDQYIIGSLLKTTQEGYYDYYTLTIPHQATQILIEYISDICNLYVNIRDEIEKPTAQKSDYSYIPKGYEMISIDVEGVVKNKIITFAVGAKALDDVDTAYYSLKVTIPKTNEKNIPPIIPLLSDQETLAKTGNTGLAYYLLPIHGYDNAQNLNIFVKANSPGNTLVLYANEMSMETYDALTQNEKIAAFPTKENAKYNSETNLVTELLLIDLRDIQDNDYYILITVSAKQKNSLIQILSTYRNFVNGFTLNPFSNQIIAFNNDKNKITLNLPGDDNYLVEVTQLMGSGKIVFDNQTYKVSPTYNNVGITISKGDNILEIEANDEANFFICYVFYVLRNGENYDEIDINRSNGIVYRNSNFPLIFYSKIPDVQDITVNFRFYKTDSANTFSYKIFGVITDEETIIKKKGNKGYNPDLTNIVEGSYFEENNFGLITFTKDFIQKSLKPNTNNYIYISISGIANAVYNQIYLDITPVYFTDNISPLSLNQFYYGVVSRDTVPLYSIRKPSPSDTFVNIDLGSMDNRVSLRIFDTIPKEPIKQQNSTLFKYNDINNNYGKRSVYFDNQENKNEIYIGVVCEEGENIPYMIRYNTGTEEKAIKSKYTMKSATIGINTKYDSKASSMKIELTPFEKVNGGTINGKYFISLYKKDSFKSHESADSILVAINKIATDYSMHYTIPTEQNKHIIELTKIETKYEYIMTVSALIKENLYSETLYYNTLDNPTDYKKEEPGSSNWLTILISVLCTVIVILILVVLFFFHRIRKLRQQRELPMVEANTNLLPDKVDKEDKEEQAV